MKMTFKEFLKTTKGKLTVSLGALLLSWIFLLIQFSGSISAWIPNESRKAEMNKEIRKFKAEQQAQQLKVNELKNLKKRYQEKRSVYWQTERDGEPNEILRQKVETAAKEVEITLENIGSVRTSRINNELYFAEMDVSGSATFETVIRFLGKIRDLNPKISWSRITMNLSYQRFRPTTVTTARTSNMASPSSTSTETRIMLNGTLRVIAVDRPSAQETPGGGKGGSK